MVQDGRRLARGRGACDGQVWPGFLWSEGSRRCRTGLRGAGARGDGTGGV